MMDTRTSFAKGQLKSLIERIERLEEEKQAIATDIKEVYGEAKANGFDTRVMRKVVALRKLDAAERLEQEAILDLYLSALGMQLSLALEGEEEPTPAPAPKKARARKRAKADAGEKVPA